MQCPVGMSVSSIVTEVHICGGESVSIDRAV
jgi:hypothetical protein